jgi:AraC-like DNA-binding protein
MLIQSITGILAISQLLFMGIAYLVHYRHFLLGRLTALYSLSLICYIVLTMPEFADAPSAASLVVRALAVAAPALLWMVSQTLFNDTFHRVWIFVAVTLCYIVTFSLGAGIVSQVMPGENLTAALQFYRLGLGESSSFFETIVPWMIYLPFLIMLAFAGHALMIAIAGFTGDLVEVRRQFRFPFVVSMGLVLFFIVLTALLNFSNPLLRTIFYLYIFLCTLFFNIVSFRLTQNATDLLPASSSGQQLDPGRPVFEDEFFKRLVAALEKDQLYTNPALTIGALALRAKSREYKLRRFINKNLGYRNFNQFLNNYRIQKAADLLLGIEENRSIAEIALMSGFASLSVFNRVFKEKYGLTPSDFKSKHRYQQENHDGSGRTVATNSVK